MHDGFTSRELEHCISKLEEKCKQALELSKGTDSEIIKNYEKGREDAFRYTISYFKEKLKEKRKEHDNYA